MGTCAVFMLGVGRHLRIVYGKETIGNESFVMSENSKLFNSISGTTQQTGRKIDCILLASSDGGSRYITCIRDLPHS